MYIQHYIDPSVDQILATVCRHNPSFVPDERLAFLTHPALPIQAGFFRINQGDTIQRHYHPRNVRTIDRTMEVLIVTLGSISVQLYTVSKAALYTVVLNERDLIILVNGGHEIRGVSPGTSAFYEVKQGPYYPDLDKVHF